MSDGTDGADGQSDRSRDGEGEEDGARWAERFLIVTSALFTIGLFAFVIWQASMTTAVAEPTATITETETLPSGDVKVAVAVRNMHDVGLVMATVEVDCDTPPPELTFEHIPPDDRRTGYVICPSGTENESATVSTWIEA